MQTQESTIEARPPCGRIEFDFTHFDDDAFDDSGAQAHVVEPDYDAVFTAIMKAIDGLPNTAVQS